MRESVVARRLLELDTPDCGCKVRFVRLCVRLNGPQGCRPQCVTKAKPDGCRDRYETGRCACKKGKCDCPPALLQTRPCRHTLEAAQKLIDSDWVKEILRENILEYGPIVGTDRAWTEILRTWARRMWAAEPHGRNHGEHHGEDPYHDPNPPPLHKEGRGWRAIERERRIRLMSNRFPEFAILSATDLRQEKADRVSVQGKRCRNGPVYEDGLRVVGPNGESREPAESYPKSVWDAATLHQLYRIKPLSEWTVDMLRRLQEHARRRIDPDESKLDAGQLDMLEEQRKRAEEMWQNLEAELRRREPKPKNRETA